MYTFFKHSKGFNFKSKTKRFSTTNKSTNLQIHRINLLSLFVSLGESINFNSEWHRTSPQNVHHSIIVKPHVEAQLLKASGEPACGHLRLILAGCAGACDLARRPYARRGVRSAQFHGDHAALLPVFNVHALEGDVAQVQVTPDTKTAHYIADDYVDFGLFGGGFRFVFKLVAFAVGSEVGGEGLDFAVDEAVTVRERFQGVLLDGCCHNTVFNGG